MPTPDPAWLARYTHWMEAIQQQDQPALQALLGAEYTYTASNQGRMTRAQWLDNVARYTIESFAFPALAVTRYGDVAVAQVECRQAAIFGGAPRSGDFLITDVWVWRDTRWQVIARSSILIAPAP